MTYRIKCFDNGRMILKEQLASLLDQEKMSLSHLAKETDIPVQTLHNWLNGVAPRSLEQLKKVSDFFETTIVLVELKRVKEPFSLTMKMRLTQEHLKSF